MTAPRTVAVTGATGTTGRHVVAGLLERGVAVRALVRRPLEADLPREVAVVRGFLEDDGAVRELSEGADAAFLLWPTHDAAGAEAVVATLADGVDHLVYLSAVRFQDGAGEAMPGVFEDVEALVAAAGPTWTFVRAGGFAANTLEWAEQIRGGDVVRFPYPDAGRSLVDERDVADVVVHALLDPALAGRAVAVTGPETLTQREQVAAIGAAIGRDLRVEEQSPDEARRELAAAMGEHFATGALSYWAGLVDRPELVADGVAEVTGHPARRFADWCRLHRADFA